MNLQTAKQHQTHAGKIAVVTGAARGLGFAIAQSLAQRGAAIVAIDLDMRDEAVLQIKQTGVEVLSLEADVSDPDAWSEIAKSVTTQLGGADILVNNAAIYPHVPFDDLDYPMWRRVLSVNLDSAFLGAKAIAPLIAEHGGGSIVNLGSNSVSMNEPGLSAYMSSKMGIVGLTRGLANDLGRHKITVNAVCPTLTKTEGTSGFGDAHFEMVISRQAIPRQGMPDDITGLIAFLTGPENVFMTGQTLSCDGGLYRL